MLSNEDRLRSLVESAATTYEPSPEDVDAAWRSIARRGTEMGSAPSAARGWKVPWRVVSLGTIAAVTLAAVIVPLALRGAVPAHVPSRPAGGRAFLSGPLVDVALTPPGWSPVALGDAQISVPSSWLLFEGSQITCSNGVGGWVFVGEPVAPRICGPSSLNKPANVVSMLSTRRSRSRTALQGRSRHERWAFGVEVTATGPLAARVLATLTRSPLSVVLGRHHVRAPADWHSISYGGISFSVPGSWRESHSPYWLGCFEFLTKESVVLNSASVNASPISCMAPTMTAGSQAAVPGAVVAAGRWVEPGASRRCMALHGLRVCVQPPSEPNRALSLSVLIPGHSQRVLVELGLAGSGAVPRAILDSLRASPARST